MHTLGVGRSAHSSQYLVPKQKVFMYGLRACHWQWPLADMRSFLRLPFPAVAVRPEPRNPVCLCSPKRKPKGVVPERDLHGMPAIDLYCTSTRCRKRWVISLTLRSYLTMHFVFLLTTGCRLSQDNLLRQSESGTVPQQEAPPPSKLWPTGPIVGTAMDNCH